MYSHERWCHRAITRLWLFDIPRSTDSECCDGKGTLPRWQNSKASISTSSNTPSSFLGCGKKGSHSLERTKIDPKRAIPRDEQERTSKIFVGGVSQDATEQDFKEYFMQYGRVVDATLMIDKDTGRPRGFGFVTFDSEAAVDATLQGDLTILGKPIEVKKAQPRGNMREEDDGFSRRGGRRGGKSDDRFRENDRNNFDSSNSSGNQNQVQNQNQQSGQGIYGSGMTPQMMAQYWQRMQQYFAQMQQQLAMTAAQGGAMNQMGMGGMNPAMMQQMQAMQQVKQMQAMQQQMGQNQGSQSPHAQSPLGNNMQGLNPAMIQQMQQLQQMQMQSQQSQGTTGFGGGVGGSQSTPAGAPSGPAMGSFSNGNANPGGRRGTPGYNAQDQLLFEQQKYEQQQARRAAQEVQQVNQFQPGGPTSWEGMYDDVPQPNMGGGMGRGPGQGGFNRQMSQGSNSSGNKGQQQNRGSQGPQSAPPANAPTGPKNHGVPGANYRGGGRGSRGGGFHPYARK